MKNPQYQIRLNFEDKYSIPSYVYYGEKSNGYYTDRSWASRIVQLINARWMAWQDACVFYTNTVEALG